MERLVRLCHKMGNGVQNIANILTIAFIFIVFCWP